MSQCDKRPISICTSVHCVPPSHRHTWPRMPAHSATLWRHLAAAYARETAYSHQLAAASSTPDHSETEQAPMSPLHSKREEGTTAAASHGEDEESVAAAPPPLNAVQAEILRVCSLLVECGGEGFGRAVREDVEQVAGMPAAGEHVGPEFAGRPRAGNLHGAAGLVQRVQVMLSAQG